MALITKIYYTTDNPQSADINDWTAVADQTDFEETVSGLANGVEVFVKMQTHDDARDLYSPFTEVLSVIPANPPTTGPSGSALVLWARPSATNVGAGVGGTPADQTLAETTVTGQHKWRTDNTFEFLWAGVFEYNNYDFTKGFIFSASNVTVTFNNCNFSGSGGGLAGTITYWIKRNLSSALNLTVICNDCTFEKFSSSAIDPGGIEITYNRCVIQNSGGDAAKCGPASVTSTSPLLYDRQPFTMRQCYITQIGDAFYNDTFNDASDPDYRLYENDNGPTIHADGIQADDMQEAAHLTVVGNYFDCTAPWVVGGMVSDGDGHVDYNDWHMGGQTALVFVTARNLDVIGTLGAPTFVIEGNWFSGGNYTIQMTGKGSHPIPTGGLIRYNHFYHGYGTGLVLDAGDGQAEYLGNQFEYAAEHVLNGTIVPCDTWFENGTGWPTANTP